MPGLLKRLLARLVPWRSAEEKFRRIFEQSPDIVALIEWKSGRYVEVNRAFEEQTGHRSAEVVGRTPQELDLIVDPGRVEDFVPMLKREGVVRDHAFEFRTRWGNLRQCRMTASLFELDGVPHMLTVSRDVTEQLRAAQAQRENETLLQLSLGAARMGSWVRDLETDHYTWSPEAAAIFGRAPDAMPKTFAESLEMIVPEDRPGFQHSVAAHDIDDGEFVSLVRVRRDDGRVVWVESRGRVLVDEHGHRRRHGVVADVTARETAAEALRASESRFSRLFEEIPGAVSLLRVADQSIVAINRGWETAYGLSRAEVLGRSSSSFGLWPDAPRREEFFRRLRAEGLVRDFETRLRRADGELATVSLAGREIEFDGTACWLLVGHDITERKQAETGREESEALLRLAMEASGMGVFRRDLPGGRIAWSPELERLHGIPVGSFGGTDEALAALIHPDDVAPLREAIERSTADPDFAYVIEQRIRRPDGNERWVEVRGRTFFDAQGVPLRRIGTVLDITGRKMSELAVRRENLLLEERVAARTRDLEAAVGELESFSYTVAHDLRAPLRAVAGFGAMLREDHGAKLGEDGRAMLDRMTGAAERLSEMIDALLELSRIMRTRLSRKRVDLSVLAKSIAGELAASEPQRQVGFDIAEGLEVEGDPRLLRQVLENLLGNAWKYSARRAQARIAFGAAPPRDGQRSFWVRDNGAGFDSQYAGKLFGVFQRLHTPAEFPGHGVGLSTVKRIIERHGGTVRAESVQGEGATFYFTLPVTGAAPPARAAA